jgi:penicillin-binding protein 2
MAALREHRAILVLRLRVLGTAQLVLLAGILLAYWLVQVSEGAAYRELADHNRLRRAPLLAPRGLILDRRGRVLVENAPSYSLLLRRDATTDAAASLAFAASRLARPAADLEAAFASQSSNPRFRPVLLAEELSLADVAAFELTRLEHPEFEVRVDPHRLYRLDSDLAHVLGYIGAARPEDLAREPSATPDDLFGRGGVERSYDHSLRGHNGEQVLVVDSRGRPMEVARRIEPEPGDDLRLTIDLELQQEAERAIGERRGAVVAMDPRNGAVLVMLSSPSFNPNLFSRRLDRSTWQDLVADPGHPLQNRAIRSAYPPGSPFKVVMGAAAIAERAMGLDERVYCGGQITLHGRRRRCWKQAGHGPMDLHAAIQNSCNVYFYVLGERLGIERIARYARLFGFDRTSGIDLEGERAGLVPDPAWKMAVRRTPWYAGETVSVSIGQGALLATPLQMARMTGVIASRGWLATPHLRLDTTIAPPVRTNLDVTSLDRIALAMEAVVAGGTGASARLPGVRVGGKTGTVQTVHQATWTDNEELPEEHRDHAWFVSFAPVEKPELVVAVFVEHGGKGSQAAAPIARAIYERYFANRSDRPGST